MRTLLLGLLVVFVPACATGSGTQRPILARPPVAALEGRGRSCRTQSDCNEFQKCMTWGGFDGAHQTCELTCTLPQSVVECPESTQCHIGDDAPNACWGGEGNLEVVREVQLRPREMAALSESLKYISNALGAESLSALLAKSEVVLLDRGDYLEVVFLNNAEGKAGPRVETLIVLKATSMTPTIRILRAHSSP